MTLPNIALMGKARSGKDTVAARLMNTRNYTRVAFADALKANLLKVNPIVGYEPTLGNQGHLSTRLADVVRTWEWEGAKDRYPEVRRLLQQTGQHVRSLDPDFWVRVAMNAVAEANGPVVVTDCRYPNEADALKAAGFRLVRVVRPGAPPQPFGSHASETALDDYVPDALVLNAGSVYELLMRADALVA